MSSCEIANNNFSSDFGDLLLYLQLVIDVYRTVCSETWCGYCGLPDYDKANVTADLDREGQVPKRFDMYCVLMLLLVELEV